MSKYDKTLDFVVHENGELQDVLLRRACRQALFDALSLLRLHLRQRAHQLVLYWYLCWHGHCGPTSLAWPKGYHGYQILDTWAFANRKRICQQMKRQLLL